MFQTLNLSSRSCGLEINTDKICIKTKGEEKRTVIQLKLLNFEDKYLCLGQNFTI